MSRRRTYQLLFCVVCSRTRESRMLRRVTGCCQILKPGEAPAPLAYRCRDKKRCAKVLADNGGCSRAAAEEHF